MYLAYMVGSLVCIKPMEDVKLVVFYLEATVIWHSQSNTLLLGGTARTFNLACANSHHALLLLSALSECGYRSDALPLEGRDVS